MTLGVFSGSPNVYAADNPYTAPQLSSFDPNQDPVYLSYLRSLGLNENQQKDQIARQTQYLNDSLSAQRPVWADQRANAIAGIQNSAAGRGVFNSSQRGSLENKANTAVNRSIAGAERSNAYQIGNLQNSYKNNLAQNALGRQNQAIASQQRQAGQALNTQIANQQYNTGVGSINNSLSNVDQTYGAYGG